MIRVRGAGLTTAPYVIVSDGRFAVHKPCYSTIHICGRHITRFLWYIGHPYARYCFICIPCHIGRQYQKQCTDTLTLCTPK